MSHTFAVSMNRPYEHLGLPTTFAKRVESARSALFLTMFTVACIGCFGFYLFEVNQTASKGFELRALEKRMEQARASVLAYEDEAARMQAVASLQEKVKALGYVPVEQLEYIDPASNGVAVAK